MSSILLIEDDNDIREGVKLLLESEGYDVSPAATAAEGLMEFNHDISLVILDIMLPDMSGLSVCEKIREVSYVPVLFLTARSTECDKLIGFMTGGDDYITKPFSHVELLGRVRALIRRYQVYNKGGEEQRQKEEPYIISGGIRINRTANEVFVNDEETI